jgi:predicted metal-dependent enzyme (double-stranded beta helix superfamily)
MTWETLPARTLDKQELRRLVEVLAERPETWLSRVTLDGESRHFESLYRDEYVDVWVIGWGPGSDTGWHDHDISCGAVRVVRGALRESNPSLGGQHAVAVIESGESFCFGPDHIHRLSGVGGQAVSVHAYSPPLWRLGQYSISEAGVMRRLSVSYADELRPLDQDSLPVAGRVGSGSPFR